MINYSTIANTLGAFPTVTGKNTSGGGAIDGTPWLDTVINDLWGFSQNIMDRAKLSPSGVSETGATGGLITGSAANVGSQRVQGLARICGFPGEIVAWQGQDNFGDIADDPDGDADYTDPSATGVDIRLLPLNGQGVSRSSYRDLDRVTYCGDSNNATAFAYYHADDSGGTIRNPSGAWLILPDFRGRFIRGQDPAASLDPAGASRVLFGVSQGYAIRTHRHQVGSFISPTFTQRYANSLDRTAGALPFDEVGISGAQLIASETGITQGIVSVESRPYNHNARWCIRY
jgi:hypothetical protein